MEFASREHAKAEVVQEKKKKKRKGGDQGRSRMRCWRRVRSHRLFPPTSSLAYSILIYTVALLSPTAGIHCIYYSITLDFSPAVSQDPGRPTAALPRKLALLLDP